MDRMLRIYHSLTAKEKAALWVLPTTLAFAVVWFWREFDAASLTEVLEGLAHLFTVVAIVVGGIWTYLLFVRTRQRYPRANLTHRITHRKVSDDHMLLRVGLTVVNQGEVLLTLGAGETWVQRMVPWPDELIARIEEGGDPIR